MDAGYGERDPVTVAGFHFKSRPVPSAGARYPLEIHLISCSVSGLGPGTYQYLPAAHTLEQTGGEVPPERVCELFLGQAFLAKSSAIAIVAGTFGPSLARYGDRGYRYLLLEAGHVGQNLNFASSALGLGSLNLGGFLDQPLSEALRLTEQAPLYGVALGRPRTADTVETRQPRDGSG